MSELDDSGQEAALRRLRDALDARGVPAIVGYVTGPTLASGGREREAHYYHLTLIVLPGDRPRRIAIASWLGMFVWGHLTWPAADPQGLAELVARSCEPDPTPT